MLQRDGLQYSFVHRSFQEYFAALFIIRESVDRIPKILDAYCRRNHDNVMTMLFDMHQLPVEQILVLLVISDISKKLVSNNGEELKISRMMSRYCRGIDIRLALRFLLSESSGPQLFVMIRDSDKLFIDRLRTLSRLYSRLSDSMIGSIMSLQEFRSALIQHKYQ
jgi:hypothetical protein